MFLRTEKTSLEKKFDANEDVYDVKEKKTTKALQDITLQAFWDCVVQRKRVWIGTLPLVESTLRVIGVRMYKDHCIHR